MWWIAWMACGPKLPPGEVRSDWGPVPTTDSPSTVEGRVRFVVHVAAGSAQDPPSRDGTAWLTARSAFDGLGADGRTWTLTVTNDHTEGALDCAVADALPCAEALTGRVVAPSFPEAALEAGRVEGAATLVYAADDQLGPVAVELWRWRGHPRGHLPAGRTSVLPTLREDELRAFHRRWYTRETLQLDVSGGSPEVLDAVRRGLVDVGPGADPLSPMVGAAPPLPPLPAGALVVGRPWAPTEVTVWLRFPDGVDRVDAAARVQDELEDASLVDEVADWPSDAATFRATTTPDRVAAVLAARPAFDEVTVVVLVPEVTAEELRSASPRLVVTTADGLVR